ncbi:MULTISPECIES: thioredoxin domain-containing protein [Actinomycetes]|uniref:DsbA family protein n=1 Tax=Actinomycetes TaxID=1760 RepID=UPI0004BF5B10|nr:MULTISPECIES: thioredoxin domain-containing protein [Actinomycetes]
MSRSVKVTLGVVFAFCLALTAVFVVTRAGDTATESDGAVVRSDSQRLTSPADSEATFVEFLDFECEACGAMYPAVEQLRQTYGDRVTFVVRYFPLPGHFNADRAARAVVAAANQGRFEAMYRKMFDSQKQWGEQQVPLDDLFASYAADLGLDMTQFQADYTSSATRARIDADLRDGAELGVRGTPTFFINDAEVQAGSYDDLKTALNDALAQ